MDHLSIHQNNEDAVTVFVENYLIDPLTKQPNDKGLIVFEKLNIDPMDLVDRDFPTFCKSHNLNVSKEEDRLAATAVFEYYQQRRLYKAQEIYKYLVAATRTTLQSNSMTNVGILTRTGMQPPVKLLRKKSGKSSLAEFRKPSYSETAPLLGLPRDPAEAKFMRLHTKISPKQQQDQNGIASQSHTSGFFPTRKSSNQTRGNRSMMFMPAPSKGIQMNSYNYYSNKNQTDRLSSQVFEDERQNHKLRSWLRVQQRLFSRKLEDDADRRLLNRSQDDHFKKFLKNRKALKEIQNEDKCNKQEKRDGARNNVKNEEKEIERASIAAFFKRAEQVSQQLKEAQDKIQKQARVKDANQILPPKSQFLGPSKLAFVNKMKKHYHDGAQSVPEKKIVKDFFAESDHLLVRLNKKLKAGEQRRSKSVKRMVQQAKEHNLTVEKKTAAFNSTKDHFVKEVAPTIFVDRVKKISQTRSRRDEIIEYQTTVLKEDNEKKVREHSLKYEELQKDRQSHLKVVVNDYHERIDSQTAKLKKDQSLKRVARKALQDVKRVNTCNAAKRLKQNRMSDHKRSISNFQFEYTKLQARRHVEERDQMNNRQFNVVKNQIDGQIKTSLASTIRERDSHKIPTKHAKEHLAETGGTKFHEATDKNLNLTFITLAARPGSCLH